MAENTSIEWCDHTFNPWTGCTKVSPGCDHCYAEGWSKRSGAVVWGPGAPRRRTTPANWRKPLQWNAAHEAFFAEHGRRQRVFCASLADVFDNEVPPVWRADLFELIAATPHLDWLLLTKRIGNAWKLMADAMGVSQASLKLPLPNVWLGATVVNQAEAERDIPKLLQVPARVRFLSIEPMLGPIKLPAPRCDSGSLPGPGGVGGVTCPDCNGQGERGASGCQRLHWAICGGESGPGARPMHPDWPRSLRDQCAAAGVPFLFKQHGEWAPGSGFNMKPRAWIDRAGRLVTERSGDDFPKGATAADGWSAIHHAGKKAAGRLLDGVQHDGFPHA